MRLASCVALLLWIGALSTPTAAAQQGPLSAPTQDGPQMRAFRFKTADPSRVTVVGVEQLDTDRARLILRYEHDGSTQFIEAPSITIRASSGAIEISTEGATTMRRSTSDESRPWRGPLRMTLYKDGPVEIVVPGN